MTTDDVLMLANIINEWYRASLTRFERIFPQPGPDSARLLTFIDSSGGDGLSVSNGHTGSPRYYDLLVHQFLRKYTTERVVDSSDSTTPEPIDTSSSNTYSEKLGGMSIRKLSDMLKISCDGISRISGLAHE